MSQATHPFTDPGIDPSPHGTAPPGEGTLDARLAADTRAVMALPSGTLRLMDDARWFWAMIVPTRMEARELHDLPASERAVLMEDVSAVSKAVQAITRCRSVNVAALGNVVEQLHVHVVARDEDDPAWPGPVWGVGTREVMDGAEIARRGEALRTTLHALDPGYGREPSFKATS